MANTQMSEDEMTRRSRKFQERSGIIEIGSQRFEGVNINDLQLIADLGSGSYGSVTKRVIDNKYLAVKELNITDDDQTNKRTFTDLYITCKSSNCPNIVTYYGHIITHYNVYICMEMMVMCLEKLYKEHLMPKNIFIPEEILGQVTVSVIKALKYLKDTHEIIHRDVKPSNILIDWNGNIKLCDFGIAGQLIDSLAATNSLGTAMYLSPERFQDEKRYDVRADIWSLGITLVELATFQCPYQCSTFFGLMENVVYKPAPDLSGKFSPEMKLFVKMCLQKDLLRRPKYPGLMAKWYRQNEINEVDVRKWLVENVEREEG